MKKRAFLVGGYVVGLAAVALLVLYALPLVAIGDWRPFDTALVRWLTIALVSLGALGYLGYTLYTQTRQEKELAAGVAGAEPGDDSRQLSDAMKDALATLKKASGAKGDYLYDLPWYIMIGPPGTGKTTALVNSGLNFPLAKGSKAPEIKGVGGTRYCDWLFTEEAVLIDTAGRYTTQDSDAKADRQSWLAFLAMLKRNRPRQPINGVLVCISIEDVLSLKPMEVQAHADAIRARLIELHDHLKVDFPVYAFFTKADLIAGFMEFFGHLPDQGRKVVWGATFQTDDKTANMIGEVPKEMDALIARLNDGLVDRLQDEPNPTARVQIFGFPSQVASLKQPIYDFLTRIFEPTRYHSNATLRGFYFTSGTQEGTPIDQLIGALARSFGAQHAGFARYSGQGKSFFLTNLLTKVIFGEAGWVSTNRAATRRGTILKTGAGALLAVVCLILVGVWWVSYGRNSSLIRSIHDFVADYRKKSEPLDKETKIADRDFTKVLPALQEIANMPAGYAQRNDPTPTAETFGLSQRERLIVSGKSAYETALYRLFRPRLMFRMEERMRNDIANPSFLVGALPVYLMMGGAVPMDRERVIQWWIDDWSENLFRGPGNAAGRRALQDHLTNLVALDPPSGLAALDIDRALVQEAQRTIARISVADRAFEILRAESHRNKDGDWSARRKAGLDADLVFEGSGGVELDAIRVPFFYTYAGFQQDFLGRLNQVAERMKEEQSLLGDVAKQQAFTAQNQTLLADLTERYQREFINAWRTALGQLRIRLLTADKPRYVALQAAAAPTSPLAQIIEAIRDETQLTRERPAPADGKGDVKADVKAKSVAAPKIELPGGAVPGATVEAAFRPYQQLTDGTRGQRGLDDLLRGLGDVHSALAMLNDPTRAAEGQTKFRDALRNLQATATRFPEPFQAMIQAAVGAFDTDATGTTIARLQQTLAEQVTNVCAQAIKEKYPFKRTSDTDMTIQDFQKLFGPSGVIDRFYTTNLAQFADTSKATWTWNAANPMTRQLPPALIRDFQRANEIREAFFPQGTAGFSFAVKNVMLGDSIDNARLEINTGVLSVDRPGTYTGFANTPPQPPPPAPPQIVTFQWPGPIGLGAASLSFLPPMPGRPDPPAKAGPWALFRLLDTATLTKSGDAVTARFSASGREVSYQINVTTLPNPFTLAALREFRCPTTAP
jgi:type VI secretion system protein ImpL